MKQMRQDSNSNFSETLQSFKLYLLLTHLKKPHHTIISHPLHGLSTKTKKARYPSEPFCLRCIFYFHTTSLFSLIFNHFSVLRCRLHHKDTNFKANHNQPGKTQQQELCAVPWFHRCGDKPGSVPVARPVPDRERRTGCVGLPAQLRREPRLACRHLPPLSYGSAD